MGKIKPVQLVNFLKSQPTNARFIDKLKIAYRPYICPFHELLQEINQDSRVFDIGCGSGQFALLVAEFVGPKSIAGIEISEELVGNAHELLKAYSKNIEISFEQYDGKQIPKSIQKSDVIFLIDVLHHINKKDQFSFLQNIFEAIVPGTRVVIKDINKAHLFSPFNKLHDIVLASEIGNELSTKKLEKYIKEIGFSIINSYKKTMFLYPHYTFVLKKEIR